MRRNAWKLANWLVAPATSQKKTPHAYHRQLRCELLEDRRLLSTVVVNGTDGPDTFTTNWVNGQLQVTINRATTSYSNATGLAINGLGGNDAIEVKNLPFGATAHGGDGDDIINARNGQADTLIGGAGDDTVNIESYDVVQQVECINPYTPAPDNQPMHVKVLVMNFAPPVKSQGNQLLWQAFGWTDPRILAADYKATIERTSGGLINMDIVNWMEMDSLVPRVDGYVYSGDEYYNIWSTTRNFHHPDTADNAKLMNDYGVPQRVASGEIDEVWVFGPPVRGADWEASMLGPLRLLHQRRSLPRRRLPTSLRDVWLQLRARRGLHAREHPPPHGKPHGASVWGMEPGHASDKLGPLHRQHRPVAHHPGCWVLPLRSQQRRRLRLGQPPLCHLQRRRLAKLPVPHRAHSADQLHGLDQRWHTRFIPRASQLVAGAPAGAPRASTPTDGRTTGGSTPTITTTMTPTPASPRPSAPKLRSPT